MDDRRSETPARRGRGGAKAPTLGLRLRRAATGVAAGLAVAWLAWPLVGLLTSWLLLPPSFPPLATGLLMVMVAAAGLAGWFYDPGDD